MAQFRPDLFHENSSLSNFNLIKLIKPTLYFLALADSKPLLEESQAD